MTKVMQVLAGAKVGGAETFYMSLVSALNRAGLDQVAVFRTHEERAAQFTRENIPHHQLRFGGALDFLTGPRLQKICDQHQPDVVLSWMSRASRFTPTGNHVNIARLGGYYDLKYYRKCDYLACITKDLCDYVIREGWPKDKVVYMPNFTSSKREAPVDRATLDTPEGAPLFLGLGRLHTNKAFDLGLEVLSRIPEAYYWIAGEGPLRQELTALAEKLGVSDRVRFLGWRNDIAALMAAADVFLCTSRHEPFGTIMIESWAHGTPMVAAASQGPSQTITDGYDGLVTPIDDADAMTAAVRKVLDNPDFAKELVENATKTFNDKHTEEKVVQRYFELFEKVRA